MGSSASAIRPPGLQPVLVQVVNGRVLSARLIWSMSCCAEFGADDCKDVIDVYTIHELYDLAIRASRERRVSLPDYSANVSLAKSANATELGLDGDSASPINPS